jgi:hypothetical protein
MSFDAVSFTLPDAVSLGGSRVAFPVFLPIIAVLVLPCLLRSRLVRTVIGITVQLFLLPLVFSQPLATVFSTAFLIASERVESKLLSAMPANLFHDACRLFLAGSQTCFLVCDETLDRLPDQEITNYLSEDDFPWKGNGWIETMIFRRMGQRNYMQIIRWNRKPVRLPAVGGSVVNRW